ncbi:MAG TPA: sigma-70 family RNA polymerase sigma factor [Pirellulaceae bacterium]|nr:sigma-70 family RNA polymerase sigma factor [Pirellulaceae bacterium]
MIDPVELLYERVLVVRCQAGDEAAFEELVERYSPRLRYFVLKLLGTERRGGRSLHAEDLLQDVWLDAFRGLPRLADPQAFRAWIYRIARDRALGLLRKSKRTEQPLGEIHVPEEAADEDEFSPEDAARIHAGLDELPAEQREVLVLRFLEDMSYDEIARVTSQPLGTVRSRIHYGKRALRRLLET